MAFDPGALQAVLVTFYTAVTEANMRRARRDRPEYFAGGTLVEPHAYFMTLPDGTFWYLTTDGWFPGTHWRVQQKHLGDDDPDDPFAPEPGPLVPLDEPDTVTPVFRTEFETLMADGLQQLGDPDATLGGAAARVADMTPAAVVDGAFEDSAGRADYAVAEAQASIPAFDLSDVVDQANALDQAVGATQGEYNDPPPDPQQPPDPTSPEKPPYEPPDDKTGPSW